MIGFYVSFFAATTFAVHGNQICNDVYTVFAHSPFRQLGITARDAALGQYPYAVSFQRKNPVTSKVEHICSGVLASENRVVTSGQCAQIFSECKEEQIEAVLGAWNLTDPTEISSQQQRINIELIKLYPKFSARPPPYLSEDLAMIVLAQSAILSDKVYPLEFRLRNSSSMVNVDEANILDGKVCNMISWGNSYAKDSLQQNKSEIKINRPDVLQQEEMLLIGNTECKKMMEGINPVDDGMLCGVKLPLVRNEAVDCEDPTAIWKPTGDTGSALICPDNEGGSFLAGITSWGNLPCKDKPSKRITVFTRIGHYITHPLFAPAFSANF